MNRKAFTLIELLVVIAIIAILAAILFPVFAQAKLSAKQSSSLSEVKQQGLAQLMYMNDGDDHATPYVWENRGDGEWITWMEMVNPYIKNSQIFVHNAASTSISAYGAGFCTGAPGATVVSHYCYPVWIDYDYWNWFGTVMFAGFPVETSPATAGECANVGRPWASCTGFGSLPEPASVTWLVPGYMVTYPRTQSTFGWPCTTGFGPHHPPANPVDTNIQVFHLGGNNGFVDGHAKFYLSGDMNGNASRPHPYGGASYPSSPYMVVQE